MLLALWSADCSGLRVGDVAQDSHPEPRHPIKGEHLGDAADPQRSSVGLCGCECARMNQGARACPSCGSRDLQLIFRQRFSQLSAGSLLGGYDVVCCGSCGFGFADDLPGPAEFARYYAAMSKYEQAASNGRVSEWDAARSRSAATMMASHVDVKDAPVLDVGCATGAQLAALRDVGFSDLQGLDPSPACALAAQRAYGIDVVTGLAKDIRGLQKAYGLVLFCAVLEHLFDPISAMRDVAEVLDPDGMVYVEVPDATGFAECADAPYQEFSTEHINFFTPRSLEDMMGRVGFAKHALVRVTYDWSSGTRGPAIQALFHKGPPHSPTGPDLTTRAALEDYVAVSAAIDARVSARLRELAAARQPLLVWGTGAHTMRLLRSGGMDGLNIVAFVDSDLNYQGRLLAGREILAPSALAGRAEAILVSSGTVHREIARQIREEHGFDNQIILLYD
jgi:SAM-dependent methyltransferase